MTALDQKIMTQIIKSLENGTLDLSHVPALLEAIQATVDQQVAATLQHDQAWYQQEFDQIRQTELTKLAPKQMKAAITAQLEQQQAALNRQQAQLEDLAAEIEVNRKKQFWRDLTPPLAGFAVCLLLATVFFFVLETLVYQGIWTGWGLNKLYTTVVALQPNHPYGAVLLGIVGFVVLAGAIYGSFWAMVHAVAHLSDFEPAKLMFWRKNKNHSSYY